MTKIKDTQGVDTRLAGYADQLAASFDDEASFQFVLRSTMHSH